MTAIQYGIPTHCIGGTSVYHSAVLAGEAAYRAVQDLHPDILFFSSRALGSDGTISDPTEEENHLRRLMLERASKSVFLCDSEKFGKHALYTLAKTDRIDICVFDKPFPELKTQAKIL